MKSVNHWNQRYKEGGTSGPGSYGDMLSFKLSVIKDNIPADEIKSIYDFGCGDFNFGSHLADIYPEARYTASDQSSFVIKANKMKFPKVDFKVEEVPSSSADLILCIDVLFHIIEEEDYKNVLLGLKNNWSKYLVITAFDHSGSESDNRQVNMRKLNESFFGKPIVKVLTEPNGSHLYIFKK